MSSTGHIQSKTAALEIIKSYRVPELQALLDYANLPRQGQKRDLLQRCKILIGTSFTPQLANKIQQINRTRLRSTRSNHVSSSSSASKNTPIVLPKTPPLEVLPAANQIQFTSLPFFDKMRTIESSNMPVDWHTFSPLRFTLNETDIDLIRKNTARVFLRIAPTTVQERHNDVLPPYLFVQCNNQPVINNNLSKTVGSQAHSVTFPTDITEKLIFKANASNTLTYLWLQSPTNMSLKNLPKSYTLSIQLVHCVSMDTLFDIIVKREPYSSVTKPSDPDSDIEVEDLGLMTTRHRVSLLCPITQSLISVPAKSANCSHLTCFDLKAFLQMNERRLQWACPLCKKSAAFETLRVDDRLQRVLTNVPANCSTVEIDSSTKLPTDCQYILDSVKQEKMEIPDVPHLADSTEHSSNKSQHQSDDSDCIVLSSGSESEDEDEDEVRQSNDASPLRNNRRDSSNDDRQSSSSKTAQSSPSPLISAGDDRSYWDDLAQITYDLSSDGSAKNSDRKRSNSSTSSILSSASSSSKSISHGNSRKRRKHSSPTSDVEVITLSSSDSSDDDEPSS